MRLKKKVEFMTPDYSQTGNQGDHVLKPFFAPHHFISPGFDADRFGDIRVQRGKTHIFEWHDNNGGIWICRTHHWAATFPKNKKKAILPRLLYRIP